MEQWYIARPGAEPEGPLSTEELVQKIRRGGIDGDVKVCPATGSVWVALADVPQFSRALRRAPTMVRLPTATAIAAATAASAARSPAAAAAPALAAAAPAQHPVAPPTSGRPPPGPNRAAAAAARASAPPAARGSGPPEARASAPPAARVSAPPTSGSAAAPIQATVGAQVRPAQVDGDATPRRPSRGHIPPASAAAANPLAQGLPVGSVGTAPPAPTVPYWLLAGVGGFLMLMGAGATFAGLQNRGLAVMLLGLAVIVVAGRPRG